MDLFEVGDRMKSKWTVSISMLSLIIAVKFLPTEVRADEVCNTITECRNLEARIKARLAAIMNSPFILIDGIVRYADGSVVEMGHVDGARFCQAHGLRLPTAREFALIAKSMGAKGLLETSYPDEPIGSSAVEAEIEQRRGRSYPQPGYYYISRHIPDPNDLSKPGKEAVDFYYSHSGYNRPTGVQGEHMFWSSSLGRNTTLAASLNGVTGVISYHDRFEKQAAVLCLPPN